MHNHITRTSIVKKYKIKSEVMNKDFFFINWTKEKKPQKTK